MKNKWLTMAGAAAALVGLSTVAQATIITGDIEMTGDVTLYGGSDLLSATSATFDNVNVVSSSGAYGSVPSGTSVDWTPNAVSLNPPVAPSGNLWTFQYGLLTYSFTATSMSRTVVNDTELEFSGAGKATITGIGSPYLPLGLANWTLFITGDANSGYTFEFFDPANFNFTPVQTPDGGTTAAFLGMALCGLGFFRKKLIG
ncbi:MAG: hypothetical protein KGJ60_11510 [Verrucomicrobiota bacterium]|nr:hypothetical protein [Verrucomicrobiota bacterium]